MSGLDNELDSSGDESHRGFGSIRESDRRSLANLDQLDAGSVVQLTPVVDDDVGFVPVDYIPLDPEEPFVFQTGRLNFAQDFRHYAVPAAAYCDYTMPPPVILPNGELPSGENYAAEDSAVDPPMSRPSSAHSPVCPAIPWLHLW